jgi:hypothetical protein
MIAHQINNLKASSSGFTHSTKITESIEHINIIDKFAPPDAETHKRVAKRIQYCYTCHHGHKILQANQLKIVERFSELWRDDHLPVCWAHYCLA